MSTTYSPGRYQAQIIEQGFAESTGKHVPYFFMQFRILGRYIDSDTVQECQRFERTYQEYLVSETSINILKGALEAIDVHITGLAQLEPTTPGAINLVGRVIPVICEYEVQDGKQWERWRILRQRTKLDLSALQGLSDKFAHLLRGNNGHATPAPTEPTGGGNAGDAQAGPGAPPSVTPTT